MQKKRIEKSRKEKIAEALAKKPSSLNKTPANLVSNQLLKQKLVRNGKNRKRITRPHQVTDPGKIDVNMDVPLGRISSYELATPSWFRTEEKVQVSVIIPMYKSREVIVELIKSWPLKNKLSVEAIFVDDACPNNSKDVILKTWNSRKSQIEQPIGKIICNKTNGGYGTACNVGANAATGEYLIFLNADTLLTKDWIEPMIDVFADPEVGIVGNLHIKQEGMWNGTIDSAGSEWRWGDNSFVHIGRHSYKKKGIRQPMTPNDAPPSVMQVGEREMVTGCCFAIKKSLFDYIGGFNPNYRIGYWEDSELCMATKELGYKIMFTPHSIIHHKLGHTGAGGHKFYQHNVNYFKNKWIASGRLHAQLIPPEQRPLVNSILVKRSSAHGDALVATGVCSALKKKYPEAKIMFSTMFPEVAKDNPYIDEFVPLSGIGAASPDVFYNLDLSYEWRPKVNILSVYAEHCGVKEKDCIFYLKKEEYKDQQLPKDFIVIHPGTTNWTGRDWPHENFTELAQILKDRGENIVSIGKYTEGTIPCDLDLRGKTSIFQLAWILSKAKLFVGIDSFPMHIAQIADIPAVAFFGCIDPKLRIFNHKLVGVTAENLECLGCHHRHPAPATVNRTCDTGTHNCVKNVSVQNMLNVIDSILKEPTNVVSLMG